MQVGDTLFRVGDKVMQTKNNYGLEWYYTDETRYYNRGVGVFNGDMGRITRIDPRRERGTVCFDGSRDAVYAFAELEQLEHAYAVTVHKSQGSEFPVVTAADVGRRAPLSATFYTPALTRAVEKVIFIGQKSAVEAMVANNRITGRYTTLDHELRELAEILGAV